RSAACATRLSGRPSDGGPHGVAAARPGANTTPLKCAKPNKRSGPETDAGPLRAASRTRFAHRVRVQGRRTCHRGTCHRVAHSGAVVPAWRASPRPISASQLHALPRFHLWPINPVVCWGPYPVVPVGDLILGLVSRLDAFSGYPDRT